MFYVLWDLFFITFCGIDVVLCSLVCVLWYGVYQCCTTYSRFLYVQHQHSVERQLAQTDSSQILHTVSSHQPIDATTSPIDSEYDDWKPKSILKYKTSSTGLTLF